MKKDPMAPKVKRTQFAEEAQAANSNFDPTQYKFKTVTIATWKWQDGETKYFRIDSEMKIGKIVQKANKDGAQMAPATVLSVTRLDTNKQAQIIVGAVFKSTLEENYPDGAYVGKSFAVTQSKIDGKRYRGYSVSEIENA